MQTAVDTQTSVDVVLPNSMMQMQNDKSKSRPARIAAAVGSSSGTGNGFHHEGAAERWCWTHATKRVQGFKWEGFLRHRLLGVRIQISEPRPSNTSMVGCMLSTHLNIVDDNGGISDGEWLTWRKMGRCHCRDRMMVGS